MSSADRRVQRHEGANVVAQLLEFPEQGPGHVGESAGFCIRHDLRTQDAQLQWNHAKKSSKRTIGIAKNLVRSMSYCGTLGTAGVLAGKARSTITSGLYATRSSYQHRTLRQPIDERYAGSG